MLKVFIILIITSAIFYSQNNLKRFDYCKPDSGKTENSPFHYLTPDSLGWNNLPPPDIFKYYQDGLKYSPTPKWKQSSGKILVYRPDSNIIYNMPEFIPDETIKYNMPKAQPDNGFPIVLPKEFKNEHPKKYFERKE